MPINYGSNIPSQHTNAFVDLCGVPYLLGEYIDKNTFRQIDRSLIRSEIFIDTSESMRAIIDIKIDDIGKRASDGLPMIIGNNTKQMNLLDMVSKHANSLDRQFDIIRSGIIAVVNYQLENQRTFQTIRSASETIKINTRNYFLDINPRDIDDNAIIVNFYDLLQSTINQFTHGTDKMVIRITSIQLFYECTKRGRDTPNSHDHYDSNDYYNHQLHRQNNQFIGMPDNHHDSFHHSRYAESIVPSSWMMFNRFYRFDNLGQDIILHTQEFNDPNTPVFLLPCGTVQVNRSFMVNPGHMIIFKFNIWKNDLTIVNNCQPIAKALGVHPGDHDWDNKHDHDHNHHHHHKSNHHDIINFLKKLIENDENYTKDEILEMISDLLTNKRRDRSDSNYVPLTPEEIQFIIDNVFNK